MADTKISGLPASIALNGTDVIPATQSDNSTRKITLGEIDLFIGAPNSLDDLSDVTITTPIASTASSLRILADTDTNGVYEVVEWTPPSGGGGESNTASNLGAGEGVFGQKSGVDLQFKSLVAGTNVTLNSDGTSITINASGGGGATNLGYTPSPTDGTVTSDTGTDATITLAGSVDAGLMSPAQNDKLAGIESGATADQTGAEIKAAYEAEADTNAFTDAEQTKLAGITAGATPTTVSTTYPASNSFSKVTQTGDDYEINTFINIATIVNGSATLLIGLIDADNATKDTYQLNSASDTQAGLLPAATKVKIDGLENNATANPNAIESDVAGELNALTDKPTPVGADVLLIEDSADSFNKKKITVGSLPTGGGGEANTASNLGAGEGTFAQKSGIDLQFKSLVAGTNVSLASDADTITINSTGGSGDLLAANNLSDVTNKGISRNTIAADKTDTGVETGMEITAGSGFTINVAAGYARFVDATLSGLNPTVTQLDYAGGSLVMTGVVPGQPRYIWIDSAGNLTENDTVPRGAQARDFISLGYGITFDGISWTIVRFIINESAGDGDFIQAMGYTRIPDEEGDYAGVAGTLRLKRTEMRLYGLSANFQNDRQDPNRILLPEWNTNTGDSFFYSWRDNVGGFINQFGQLDIITDRYDDGTSAPGASIPNGIIPAGAWGFQIGYVEPTSLLHGLQFGTAAYPNLEAARIAAKAILQDSIFSPAQGVQKVSIIYHKSGATDTNDTPNSFFYERVFNETDLSAQDASSVLMETLGLAENNSLQAMNNEYHSTALTDLSSGIITDDGSGTAINVTGGQGWIKGIDSVDATLYAAKWADVNNLSIPDNQLSYIYVDDNNLSPTIVASTTEPTEFNTNLFTGTAYRRGTELYINSSSAQVGGDHVSIMWQRNKDLNSFAHVEGALTSEVGARQVTISAGMFWGAMRPINTSSFDSSGADTFEYLYQDGAGGWIGDFTASTISNTQYDDGSGTLASLGNNQYGVHWVYIGTDSKVHILYGRGSYSLTAAENVERPSNEPPWFQSRTRLIAKLIIQEGGLNFDDIRLFLESTAGGGGAGGIQQVADDTSPALGGNLDGAGFSSSNIKAAVNIQTGVTYTLVPSDSGRFITLNNAASITVTVPTGLGAGFTCNLVQKGAGAFTLSPSGTTLNNRQGHASSNGLHSIVSLTSDVADNFYIGGDTA